MVNDGIINDNDSMVSMVSMSIIMLNGLIV